jgi:hypothetical protein
MVPGVKRQCAISDTAVISAAVPVIKHSEKPLSSSERMRRMAVRRPSYAELTGLYRGVTISASTPTRLTRPAGNSLTPVTPCFPKTPRYRSFKTNLDFVAFSNFKRPARQRLGGWFAGTGQTSPLALRRCSVAAGLFRRVGWRRTGDHQAVCRATEAASCPTRARGFRALKNLANFRVRARIPPAFGRTAPPYRFSVLVKVRMDVQGLLNLPPPYPAGKSEGRAVQPLLLRR